MRLSFKRVLAIALSVMMLVPMISAICLNVNAAGTLSTINGLTATWTDASNSKGSASWSASGTSITGTATGYKQIIGRTVTTTLTLQNNSGSDATLKFNYTLTNGGSVSGAISGTSGSYEEVLANGASITITLKSPGGASTNTLSITGLALISADAGDVTTTFKPAVSGGNYTVAVGSEAATTISEEIENTSVAGTEYTLTATASSGYQFFCWYNETTGSALSYDAVASYTPTADSVIIPKFVSSTKALFGVGSAKFDDLTEAGAYAANGSTKTIVLLNNGTVSGNHTIPAGVTLLVPFDTSNTLYTSEPGHTNNNLFDTASWVQPTAYRTLTMAAGATITVNGSISVSAKHFAGGGNVTAGAGGAPTDKVGFIKMEGGSNITLNSGANLYAWGFITGSGTVTAKSGSKVYENFQVADFRGGGATTSIANDGIVFPLSQYYVQNIEVATSFEYGAEEHVYTSLYISGSSYSAGVKFIGDGAMFQTSEGAILTKTYDGTKDKLRLDVDGDVAISNMSLSLAGTEIDSSTFILPINNNIDIYINSGVTSLMQDISLLPGSSLTIANGATLKIEEGTGSGTIASETGYNLFIYDKDEWTSGYSVDTFDPEKPFEENEKSTGLKFVHQSYEFIALKYVPGRTYTRTAADIKDVTININGTLVADGFVYTTLGGANIISSEETGKVVFNSGAGTEQFTYQAAQNDTTPVYYVIPITSAVLTNGDGSTVATAEAEAGTVYEYCSIHDKWFTGECADCAIPVYEITWVGSNGNLGTEEFEIDSVPSYKGDTPTKAQNGCNVYTFAGWSTEANGGGTQYPVGTALPAVTGDVTYYAYFSESISHTAGEAVVENEVEAGCNTEGSYDSVVYCTECGTELNRENITLSATGKHTADKAVVENNVAPDCKNEGSYDSVVYCTVCGNEISRENITLSATGHTEGEAVVENEVAADCDTDGSYDTVVYCTVCNEELSRVTTTVPANGHTADKAVVENNVAPDCVTDGSYDTVVYCTVCGEEISRVTTTVPATGHTEGEEVKENEVAADCDTDGSYDTVVYCTVCGEEISRVTTTVPATGHTEGEEVVENEVAADCDTDGSYDTVVYCTVCGEELSRETTTVSANGHTAGDAVVENEVAADCDTDGSYDTVVYCTVCGNELSRETTTVPANGHSYENGTCACGYKHGWVKSDDGNQYYVENVMSTGWVEIEGSWYYLDAATGYAATGISRVPYPETEINGVKYSANEEDKAYADFLDADTALFVFDDNGVFQSASNGFVTYENATRWSENGLIAWHVGMVEVDGEYYYFIGDDILGGNVMATGNVYISRNTTTLDVTIGGVYTFDAEGKLCKYDGITEVSGIKYYYDNYQLMLGAGLTKVDDAYYYVRSNGALVVNAEKYWVAYTNGYDITVGEYAFDADGKMIIPEADPAKNGIYAEDGGLFYYVDGVKAYNAGLIEYTGKSDNGIIYENALIYVRSNGQLATGTYWITTTNGLKDAGKYTFDADGKMEVIKNGVVSENGALYYYENNVVKYAAGLVEYNGSWIYVRSNGQLICNQTYWCTNVPEGYVQGYYTFDENGHMIGEPEKEEDLLNGVHDGYYYVDGKIAYGAGLVEIEEGKYIYVRSNGQLATGNYWVTNNKGLLESKSYDFGEDGYLVIE